MSTSANIITVNMHEAKSGLSRLVQDVLDGKRVQIARNGHPVVELHPIAEMVVREPGTMKQTLWVSDDFDTYDAAISELFDGTADADMPGADHNGDWPPSGANKNDDSPPSSRL